MKDRNAVQYYGEVPLFSWIDINPTELCNRTCYFCPRSHGYPNTNEHMSIDTAKKIGDDLRQIKYDGIINICGNGEPLLHRDIYTLIEQFYGMNVTIVTNGDKLDKNVIYNLYQSGLDYINVSLYDGAEQIDRFRELFESVGIDEKMYAFRKYYKEEELDYGITGLNNRAGIINYGDPTTNDRPCYYMHYSMAVDWNGDVLFCIQDVYGKVRTFGNVVESNISDIWIGEEMNNYRKGLLDRRSDYIPCVDCNVDGIKFGSDHAMIWRDIYENESNTI